MPPQTCLAMVQTSPRKLEPRELRIPEIGDDDALLRVEAIGDKAARRWGIDVGDRIAVETMLGCGSCPRCLTGRYHWCRTRRIYSYIPLSEAPGLWGAYAEYMDVAPNSVVHKVDPSLPPEIAVMFNPLGAGFRWAVEVPQTKPGIPS